MNNANGQLENTNRQLSTREYLRLIGVAELPPLISPFDPGYDPATVESHLDQSAHLMATLKISMACWMIADEAATRRKIAAARAHNVPTVTGGGPFEVAVAQGQLEAYLDLCAGLGITRIECGEGFTTLTLVPRAVVKMAQERGLAVQYEMGKKHEGPFTSDTLEEAIAQGRAWLDAGAEQLVVMSESVYANLAPCRADRVHQCLRNLVPQLGNEFKRRSNSMFPLEL